MISKKELEKVGSSEIVPFVNESYNMMEDYFKKFHDNIEDLKHIRTMDLEEFKHSIENFVEKYPDAKIKATGFIFSSKNPEKNEVYNFEKE
jgi:tetrahydromethanopterin S-methyltransferase subunit A